MWKMKGILKIYLMAVLLVLFMPDFMEGFQAERDVTFDLSDEKTREEIAKKQYAFIIGINRYKEFPPLQNAVNDAKEVKKVLMDRYYFQEDHIKTLFTNDEKDEATYENIIKELKEYINILTPDDSLFILFSGHGFNDMDSDKVYWVTSDAKEHFAKGEMKIGENKILKFLKKCPARHILIVSASCYSGKLFYGRLRGLRDLYKNKKSRQILTAGKGKVSDGKRYEQNSPFVKNFLEYLETNTKRLILASEMIDDLRINKNKKYKWPTDQEPIGGAVEGTGDERGSFVFFFNHSAMELQLMHERNELIESFNKMEWSRDIQIQKGEAFLNKCSSVKDSYTVREIQEQVKNEILNIKKQKREIKDIQEKIYPQLMESLDKGDIKAKIKRCDEFLAQHPNYSGEKELKEKYREIDTIKKALESYDKLMNENKKSGTREKKKGCRKFLKEYKDEQNYQQVKTLTSQVNSLFNTLKTPRLYFGSLLIGQIQSEHLFHDLNLEIGYIFGERFLLIPFVSYDIYTRGDLPKDEVTLSNSEKINVELRQKGILKVGLRFGIRNSIGKKNNANIFINYGRYFFSISKVFNHENLEYDFKRIGTKKAFDLFSFGLEVNVHMISEIFFNLSWIETFPGKGSINYEIYIHPGSSEIVSYALIDNYTAISFGIKIYFLKR